MGAVLAEVATTYAVPQDLPVCRPRARVLASLRRWRAAVADLVRRERKGASCMRALEREKETRERVGELLGESCTVDVDGETIAYEPVLGEVFYREEWEGLLAWADPIWRAHKDSIIDSYRPVLGHRLTIRRRAVKVG